MMLIRADCVWTDQQPLGRKKGAVLPQTLDCMCVRWFNN